MTTSIALPGKPDLVAIDELTKNIDTRLKQEMKTALSRAKVKIMTKNDSTFISTVLFSLKTVLTKQIPTAATDGLNILINPAFFIDLSPDERVGLLFHETFHVVYNHMYRGRDLNQQKYNQAADYVINQHAVDANFVLPKGALLDDKYRGMSTREVYDLLPDPDPDDNNSCGGTGMDVIYDPAGMDPNDPKQIDLTNTLIKAVQQAKLSGDNPGSVPGEIQVMIDELINPKLPWTILLQNYMNSYAKEDFSWKRPSRRFLPNNYMPSPFSEKCGEICVAVDTSCSVTDEEFSHFVSEIRDIKNKLNPTKLTLISFDTCIKNIDVFHEDEEFAPKFKGRGGTNIADTWKWIADNNPVVSIIFSDMYLEHPTEDVESDILWISVNNESADMPFGETIHYATE